MKDSFFFFLLEFMFVKPIGWKPVHIDRFANPGSAMTHKCKSLSSPCWKVSTQNLPGKLKY